jgi:hypothetical protein
MGCLTFIFGNCFTVSYYKMETFLPTTISCEIYFVEASVSCQVSEVILICQLFADLFSFIFLDFLSQKSSSLLDLLSDLSLYGDFQVISYFLYDLDT